MRIDLLIEDLRIFCQIVLTADDDEQGIWISYDGEIEFKMYLSDSVCCSNSQQNNRITEVLVKYSVFLLPIEFNYTNVYSILSGLVFNSDTIKIDFSTKDTKLLNQFQITIKASDFPGGLDDIPTLLQSKFGITTKLPIRSVQVLPRKIGLRKWYLEQPYSSNANRVVLEYLREHTDVNGK